MGSFCKLSIAWVVSDCDRDLDRTSHQTAFKYGQFRKTAHGMGISFKIALKIAHAMGSFSNCKLPIFYF